MEYDRYQYSSKLFITCMISLIVCLCLLFFSIYMLPHLLFNWHYEVPEFISFWREWFVTRYTMTEKVAGIMVFLVFFIPGIFAGFISYLISNRIEDGIYGLVPEKSDNAEEGAIVKDVKETVSFSLKLFILIVCAVALLFFVEWLITAPPPTV